MQTMQDYFEQFLASRCLPPDYLFSRQRFVPPEGVSRYPLFTNDACRVLKDHLDAGYPVYLLSDFDFDGLMSGLVLYAGLHMMGFSDVSILPRDTVRGYDPLLSELDPVPDGPGLLITSDVGSMCPDLVRKAKEKGFTVIVTDHHECSLSESVDGVADVFLNPMLDEARGSVYACGRICGAYVAYLLVERFFSLYPERYGGVVRSDLQVLSHFASMATVSDRMPMEGINPGHVQEMLSFFRYLNPGHAGETASGAANDCILQNICGNFHRFVAMLQGEVGTGFDMEFLEYSVIPVVNSIKRMGAATSLFYLLLLGSSSDCDANAEALFALNKARKELVEDCFSVQCAEMESGTSPFAHIFILPQDVPGGICGLVAQKLTEAMGHPCIAVQESDDGGYAGSARTFGDYPFKTSMNDSGFAVCRGHEEACGVFFLSYADMLFADAFLGTSFERHMEATDLSAPVFDVVMDYDLDFDQDFHRRVSQFVAKADQAGPFGPGNPPPRVLLKMRASRGLFTEFGPEYAPHSRIYLGYGLQALLWRTDALSVLDDAEDGFLYFAGTMSRHRTNAGSSIQFTCHPVLSGHSVFEQAAAGRIIEAAGEEADYDPEEYDTGGFEE